MKILIVDDSDIKASRIEKCVKECEPTATVVIHKTAKDAFRAIVMEGFALLLLDIRIPMERGSEPSDESSIWLVRELMRKMALSERPMVVGTTQFTEALTSAQEVFSDYLWTIVLADGDSGRWRQQIQQAVKLSQSKLEVGSFGSASNPVDVAVVTALHSPEFERLVDAIGTCEKYVLSETSEHWVRATVRTGEDRSLAILAASADEMGMCAMGTLLTRLCVAVRPRRVLLTGIMGGNGRRVQLGDLIVIDETWDYRAGKITETGFEPDVRSRRADTSLVNAARGVLSEQVLASLSQRWMGDKPRATPRLHVGPVACSPAVLSDGKIFDEIEDQKRKVLGVEMEAYGCYDAASRLGSIRPEVLSIKAVCDLGDKEKADLFQGYCAFLAANAAMELIKRAPFYK